MNIVALTITMGFVIATLPITAHSQDSKAPELRTVRLYTGVAPDSQGSEDADIPSITIYTPAPDKATGSAVVVCPGGGYGGLAAHEGKAIAEWLNTLGVTGIVLKYRLGPRYHHPVMMNDVNRAVRYVRAHATEWKLDSKRIGVLGFSAGGHLASTSATHFSEGRPDSTDPVEKMSSRPDLAILIYPVITMTDPFTHTGSRQNLLGSVPAPELVELMSNEKRVTVKTPPTFLVHTSDDGAVPMENSLLFAMACRKMRVPVEVHSFEHGPHGIGLAVGNPILGVWPSLCAHWLETRGFLKRN